MSMDIRTSADKRLVPHAVIVGLREELGWGWPRLAKEFELVGRRHKIATPEPAAMEKQIYRLETGRTVRPTPLYSQLYCLTFSRTASELFGDLAAGVPAGPTCTARSHKFIVDLVRRWQAASGDVVFSRYLNYPGSPYERLMGWTKMAGGPETELVAELTPYVGPRTPIIDKHIYSLFTPEGTQLVNERGWTDLYLCGIDTDSCVLKTSVDAFERDLTPWILKDACASHAGPQAHNAGLLVAGRSIGVNQIIRTINIPGSVLPPVPCRLL